MSNTDPSKQKITEYNTKNEKLRDFDLAEAHSIWQHPWDLVHRVRLHDQLKKTATCPDGPGEPAILKTCSRVLDVDAAQGIVSLENGETCKGDVVIGADGVHVSRFSWLCYEMLRAIPVLRCLS
jgi:2-polyprenyl-6-methoxyphenol hydroxylase-like FAD-dependent oxidoreductase